MSESSELRQTALHDLHVELGAKMVDFAGWSMPVWYHSATDEHHAVRQSSGLFDLGHMGELFVSGPDAGEALDWSLLLEASAMPIGRARYTMICNDQGGIIDDLIAYRIGEQEWMVVANGANAAVVSAELVERTTAQGFDAKIEDRTDSFGLVAIQGPEAAPIVAELTRSDLAEIKYYRVDELTVAGLDAMVARTGYTGEDGFELFVPADRSGELWHALVEAGGDRVRPCGLASRDTLRLEAGMPLYGNELTIATTPFDVRSARLVNLERHSYASAGLAAASNVAQRHLVGLDINGRRPARAGYNVLIDGELAGSVTSGTLSPTLERPIAMALLDRAVETGATIAVDVRGKTVGATVVDLPFYKRAKPS